MIDITVPLHDKMEVWEGDPPYSRELACTIAENGCNVSKMSCTVHAGTHVDAPYHFVEGAATIDQVGLDILVGPCELIEIKDEQLVDNNIPASALPKVFKYPRILLKTSNSKTPGHFRKEMIGISMDAAKYLCDSGVKLVGVDGLSIESYYSDGSVHRQMLGHNIIAVETLDMTKLSAGFYNLVCLPLKIVGSDAAPARAFVTPLTE